MLYEYIDTFMNYLRIEKNASRLTLLSYKTDLEQFFRFTAKKQGITAAQITIEHINHKGVREYLANLQNQGLRRSTMARKLAALRSFIKYLCRENVIGYNPIAAVSTPRQEKKLPNFLYPAEVEQLLQAPERSKPLGMRDRALLETLYATGARVSELVGINLKDLDTGEAMVKVMGKGGKERIIPLGGHALEAIKLYLAEGRPVITGNKGGEALFVNRFGERLSTRSVRNIINKYVKELSVNSKVSPHTIRHTFATHLLNNGADLRAVQELLGHIKLSTTQIYTHLTRDDIKKIHEKTLPRR